MWKTLAIRVVIGVVLGWITSAWNRFQELRKAKEEGKQEVKDALDKKKQEADKEIEKLRNSDTSFDTAIDELRKRSSSGGDVLRSNKTPSN